ncbi:MAG: tRNA threonylcarbamoyladenosine dehydratase, partial [Pseudoflavonifractor sp.]
VGSWAVEALARAGVGELTLVDHDEIGTTNLNRQLEALHSTLGLPKAEALAARVLDINPNCKVHSLVRCYEPGNREDFFAVKYDYIIDAIDMVSSKLDLIQTALRRGVPIISSLGTGNKLDPSLFQITDLSKTEGCPLARVIRKELRSVGILHHRVLFSPEPPHPAEQRELPPPGRHSVPASVPWVPPVAGFLLAGDVVLTLAGT